MWTPEDREAALAWQAEEQLKCPGCGLPRDETMVDEDAAPFYVVEEVTCHACATRDLVSDAAQQDARKAGHLRAGRYFTVRERG